MDKIGMSVDMQALRAVELSVGYKMLCGFKHEIFVLSGGKKKRYSIGLGGTAYIGTSYINRKLDGIPVNGEQYIIQVRFTIFETDIPVQHMWSPGSGKYRELWSKTIESGEI